MRTFITTATILGLALAPAMAQTSATHPTGTAATGTTPNSAMPSATSGTGSASTAQMAPGAMQDALKHDLSQAGFTDIQVMPSSFLVRAKDKAGHPIMMVINPDSVTEISNIGKPATTK